MIQAIIWAERMDNVKKALEEKDFIAMSIFEITGKGEQKGITLEHRGKKLKFIHCLRSCSRWW